MKHNERVNNLCMKHKLHTKLARKRDAERLKERVRDSNSIKQYKNSKEQRNNVQ